MALKHKQTKKTSTNNKKMEEWTFSKTNYVSILLISVR